MENRRILIADTAIAVIAEQGVRALTHRAVDAAANLAMGSTSYYARTKAELVQLTVERLASLLRGYTEYVELSAARPADTAALVSTLTEWLDGLYEAYIGELRARAALILELEQSAGTDAALLRESLIDAEDLTGPVQNASLPAEATEAILAALEGCLWEHVAGRQLDSASTELDAAILSAVLSRYDDERGNRRSGPLRRRR